MPMILHTLTRQQDHNLDILSFDSSRASTLLNDTPSGPPAMTRETVKEHRQKHVGSRQRHCCGPSQTMHSTSCFDARMRYLWRLDLFRKQHVLPAPMLSMSKGQRSRQLRSAHVDEAMSCVESHTRPRHVRGTVALCLRSPRSWPPSMNRLTGIPWYYRAKRFSLDLGNCPSLPRHPYLHDHVAWSSIVSLTWHQLSRDPVEFAISLTCKSILSARAVVWLLHLSNFVPCGFLSAAMLPTQAYHDPSFMKEVWGLYGVGVFVILLRIGVRIKSVGFRGFQGDDYMVVAVLACKQSLYSHCDTQPLIITRLYSGCCNCHALLSVWHQRRLSPRRILAAMSKSDQANIIFGSKMQLLAWYTYTARKQNYDKLHSVHVACGAVRKTSAN